jgi:hypothetical protein
MHTQVQDGLKAKARPEERLSAQEKPKERPFGWRKAFRLERSLSAKETVRQNLSKPYDSCHTPVIVQSVNSCLEHVQ